MIDLPLRAGALACALALVGCPAAEPGAPAASPSAAPVVSPSAAPAVDPGARADPPPCPAGLDGVTSELTPDPRGAVLRLTAVDDERYAALDAATRAVLALDPAARRAAVLADAARAEQGAPSPTSLAGCPLLVGELDARRLDEDAPRTVRIELRARRAEALQAALREVVERLANLERSRAP
jgi:hypothetical protein